MAIIRAKTDKPFTAKEVRRVFDAGRQSANARRRTWLREEKYLLTDMMSEDGGDYENLERGQRLYNSKSADFVDQEAKFTFQQSLKRGILHLRLYLSESGKREASELGYNPDKIQEQINRNVEVVEQQIAKAFPYKSLLRHWRQGLVRGTSVVITERNPDNYGEFDVSMVNLRNTVLGSRMRLAREYKERAPAVFVKLDSDSASKDGLMHYYGHYGDKLHTDSLPETNDGSGENQVWLGYVSLDRLSRGHFNDKGGRLSVATRPDYDSSRNEIESDTWLVIFTENSKGDDDFILCERANHMMVTVGYKERDKGDIYGRGLSTKLLPRAEVLDQMQHDLLQGIRNNTYAIWGGYAGAIAARGVTFRPNAFIPHRPGFQMTQRLDNQTDVRGLHLELFEMEKRVDASGSKPFELETAPPNQTATQAIILENGTIGTINDNVRTISHNFIIPWLRDFIRVLQAEGKVDMYLGEDSAESQKTRPGMLLFDFSLNRGVDMTLQTDSELAIKLSDLNRLQIFNNVSAQLVGTGQIDALAAAEVTDAQAILTSLAGKDYLDFPDGWFNNETEQEKLADAREAEIERQEQEVQQQGGNPSSGVSPISVADPNA